MYCKLTGGNIVAAAIVLAACSSCAVDSGDPITERAEARADVTLDAVSAATTLTSNDSNYLLTVKPAVHSVPVNSSFSFYVNIVDSTTRKSVDVQLSVDAEMPEHYHGMNRVPIVSRLSEGTFLVEGMLLHMPGKWNVYFDILDDRVVERSQTTVILR